MSDYSGVLSRIPGLAGALASREHREERVDRELRQTTGVLGLMGQMEERALRAQLAPLQMDKLREEVATSKANRAALGSLNVSDPSALRRVGILTKNPALLTEADRQEKNAAVQGEHETQSSSAMPITEVPMLGVGANGTPAYRSILDRQEPRAGEVPPEVRAAMASGQPFSIGVGQSTNPAENAQRVGGLFSPLFGSSNPAVRQAAGREQLATDASNPRSVTPASRAAVYDRLAMADLTSANSQAGRQFTVDNRAPQTAAGKVNADEASGAITPQQAAQERGKNQANLSPEAVDSAAARYVIDGSLPPNLGRGTQGAANMALILSKAAAKAQEAGDDPEAARIRQVAGRASGQALGQLSKQKNLILAFEKNAIRNAALALDASEKVDRLGSPVIDRWIQAGKNSIAGDVEVARLNTAMRTFVNEYARITTSVTGGGVTSDTARREIDELLRGAQTKEQVRGVIDLMKQEMENRRIGYEEQEKELKGSMGTSRPSPSSTGVTMPSMAAIDAEIARRAGR